MKEELTSKMHREFQVSDETDVKHRCFSALECIYEYNYSIEDAAEIYGITISDIQQHRAEFESLLAE